MSWFSKNYEKAALGGAVAVALGLVYLGYAKFSGVDDDFGAGLKGSGPSNPEVASADLIPKAQQSLQLDRTWKPGENAKGRTVDLFTGIPLFISRDNPEETLDPIADDPIHDPIPNTWWLEHRLDPGFADSPERDADGDGFSNLEEFLAKTDPTLDTSIPELLAKLMYVKDESLTWVLRPGYGLNDKFPFNYEDSLKRQNKVRPSEMVGPDELFFAKEPMKGRFKLLGSEVRKEMDKKANYEKSITYVRIEDQKPNKKAMGIIYELPSPISDLRKIDFLKYDRNAVLSLEALGLGGQEFKVEEYTEFTLPPEGGKTKYKLIEVTPEKVTVEYTDSTGAIKKVDIPKGGMPALTD